MGFTEPPACLWKPWKTETEWLTDPAPAPRTLCAAPIYTSQRQLPPALIKNCEISQAIISHGANLTNASIRHAIVGIRAVVRDGSVVEDAMVMGSDWYESDAETAKLVAEGGVPLGIGER